MRRATLMAVLSVLILGVCASAFAGTYQFSPTPKDMYELDHSEYYSWGIQLAIPSGERITGATLTIKNINNWATEADNMLYIHLLDTCVRGVKVFHDTDSSNGGPKPHDNWNGNGNLIAAYHDSNANQSETLSYDLAGLGLLSTITNRANNNSVIGFGFDPDCHYYNDGITFTVNAGTTIPVIPEPGGVAALSTGLISLVGLVSRRKRM